MNIKNQFQPVAVVVIGIVAFFALLAWAGDIDYTDQVILSMSQEQYDIIRDELTRRNGHEPSERDIAHFYMASRQE